MKLENKVIAITGGGNGMGREMALQLLKKGNKVAAIDLKQEFLDELIALSGNNPNLSIHTANIADKKRVEELHNEIIEKHGAIDVLINNAGIIQPFINVADLTFDIIDRVFQVNLNGTLYMTKAFLPYLLKRPEAYIANVSSMGGFMPFPGQTIYGASKAAIKLLTEGLYTELMDTNVNVSVIFPGAIGTNITKNSDVKMDTSPKEQEEKMKNMTLSPAKASEIIINGIEKNQLHIYVGKDSNMLNKLYRIAPTWAINTIVKKMKNRSH